MAGNFNLKIITPERIVLDTQVQRVTARARDGELSILPNHEPLVTALDIDVMRYEAEGGIEGTAAIIGGVLEVGNKEVTILTDSAELGVEIDEARARQSRERAEAEKMQKQDKLDTYKAELALARAIARLKAVEIAKQARRGKS